MQSQGAGERARQALLANPAAFNNQIASQVGCARHTVARVRRELVEAELIQRRLPERPPAWLFVDLPPQPEELARGLCVGHPEPDLWTSSSLADRARAARICASCPVQAPCLLWCIQLPASDTAVYAGLTTRQRLALRRRCSEAAS